MTEQNPYGPPPVDHGIVDAFERIDREHRWTLAEMAGFVKRTEEDPYEWPSIQWRDPEVMMQANLQPFIISMDEAIKKLARFADVDKITIAPHRPREYNFSLPVPPPDDIANRDIPAEGQE